MATVLVISVACGLGVGILSGLFGVGGGIVVIPLMRLGFGAEALVTTGTSLFVIFPTSLSSVISRLHNGRINIKLGLCVGLGGMCFSPLGSWLTEVLGGTSSMIAAAIVIAYTGFSMIRKALKLSDTPSNIEDESSMFPDIMSFEMNAKHIAQLFCVGAVAGFLSGFIGVGGGFLIVPMLMWMFGFSFKDATSASVLALCVISIPGITTHALMGHVDYLRGAAIAIGSIPGAFIGTAILKRLHEKPLRIVFGILIFAMSAILAINELL